MLVGNIRPKQTVKVIVTYVHINSLVCNTFYQFKLTSAMTPRYARGLEFPNITFERLPGSKNVEGRCNWGVNVTIRSSEKILKVESVSHKLKVSQNGNIVSLTFASNA